MLLIQAGDFLASERKLSIGFMVTEFEDVCVHNSRILLKLYPATQGNSRFLRLGVRVFLNKLACVLFPTKMLLDFYNSQLLATEGIWL